MSVIPAINSVGPQICGRSSQACWASAKFFFPLSLSYLTSVMHVPLSVRLTVTGVSTRPSCWCAQRQFGVDGSGGYCRQMERAMERAVAKGLMSPVEFHCRKAEMMESLASGVDDGTTRTSSKLLLVLQRHEVSRTSEVRVRDPKWGSFKPDSIIINVILLKCCTYYV